ncbi:hypothetical protein LWI29_010873 [Acer saccharum]|uniref:Uncharacterized protein n=1 Tax=Acer saccharum TaxID=4024 RepID=A0AA39VNQ0_ACESA|nr:hypothetical protein LWI29_010873 [Acer saccharum]
MPFGLKNAGATYQRLVNKMFTRQIGRNMEVYVDDMLTKSITADRHIDDLRETFDVLVRYGMKLNPAKCVFGVPSGRFLGYQVHQRGIEVKPEKIQALAKMVSPRTLKDVQRLTGCLASLSRFIAKSTDRCLPFFKALKKGKGVEWNEDCERAFQALKEYLGQAPLLSKPETGETLYMYLSVSKAATSSVLVRQEKGIQKPIYYTSKALLPAETRYSPAEKMALALITAARKLRPYFQAHKIRVYTNCPLKLILQKPEVSDRLTKWAIELSEFDVEYLPRTAIKAQAVADFVAEFTEPSIEVARMMVERNKKVFKWQLRVDGSSNTHGSRAGVVVSTPEGDSVECALRFDFKATNNQVEYEALIAGLKVCTVLGATINIWPKTISMIRLRQPSIFKSKEVGAVFGEKDSWITPIKEYLVNDVLPSDLLEAKRLKYRATRYSVLNGELYKMGFRIPNTIITDNGTQFSGKKFRELCDKYGINNYYASPAHPQTNGQTEAVNKIIKHNLKAKLAAKKGSWADKLPQVLWAYKTTERGSTGETPYSMAYGAEAVIPVETSFSSPRVQLFQPELNIDMLKCSLDELEERRERAQIRNTAYQQRVARYYNSHVRERRFSLGDLVLKRVNPRTRDKAAGSLADKWKGPYQITGIAGHGAYRITREGLSELPHPCNAQYLKIYYP